VSHSVSSNDAHTGAAPDRARVNLFLISFLLLYLELACIRWFPAHVLFLTFFTNSILLASFLGLSIGCLLARHSRSWLHTTPFLLAAALWIAQGVGVAHDLSAPVVGVGDPVSPQFVFFGAESGARDPTRFLIPIELVAGFFFLAVALVMIGPGQELGRALGRVPGRLQAYTLDILGSLAGILIFAACSWLELPPIAWFSLVVAMLGYFVFGPDGVKGRRRQALTATSLALVLVAAALTSFGDTHWSPYYRIDYRPADRFITVNLLGHQAMVSRDDRANSWPAYALPQLLRRDTGGARFDEVLVIGAGSGNDISRALAWGARHVDAVEIDPAIQRLGISNHPDRPYADPRVSVHIDDGRNFLRVSDKQYDLIIFALVDSLVLHSGYSNLRLESFMYTDEAFADARARLKPGGLLVMYNYFRQGWIIGRLHNGLRDAFGEAPIVVSLPYLDAVPAQVSDGLTMLIAGQTSPILSAFGAGQTYWIDPRAGVSPETPNGFRAPPQDLASWIRIGPAAIHPPEDLPPATDNWPFLYLRGRLIPFITMRGVAVMGTIALLLFGWQRRVAPSTAADSAFNWRMFFLGAGFMLVETKAVVHMALLFGSTWMVNTFVFAGVLGMVLAANLVVARVRLPPMAWLYAGLFIALAINLSIPLHALLGAPRTWQIAAAALLAFAPIFFAGVIFAVCFRQSATPDRDFGANIAGAMLGGFAENFSLLVGFQGLTVIILAFYALSARAGREQAASGSTAPRPS
jgi:spermidine synthase